MPHPGNFFFIEGNATGAQIERIHRCFLFGIYNVALLLRTILHKDSVILQKTLDFVNICAIISLIRVRKKAGSAQYGAMKMPAEATLA